MSEAAPRRRRGFTLVELLVVLSIAALVFGLALPSLVGGWGARVDLSAAAVASELRRARSDALASNRPRALLFDLETRRVTRPGRPPRTLPEGVELDLLAARSERVDEQRAYIRFLPDGSSTGGRLGFERDGVLLVAVDVDWLTGAVRVLTPGEAGARR